MVSIFEDFYKNEDNDPAVKRTHRYYDDRLPTLPHISSDVLRDLDPEYSVHLNTLMTSLHNTSNSQKIEALLDSFAEHYLMLPELWAYRIKFTEKLSKPYGEYLNVYSRGMYDFYSNELFTRQLKSCAVFEKAFPSKWVDVDYNKCTMIEQKRFREKARKGLNYPHENLKNMFEFHEAYGDDLLSQNELLKCKKALYQYDRIIATTSLRDLFCCLIQIEDVKAVIQNVEFLISKNPCCKWLWKSYLHFLKDRQPRAYLDVYQKYIRFFISDISAKEMFEQERQRIYSSIKNDYKPLHEFLMTQQPYPPSNIIEQPRIIDQNRFRSKKTSKIPPEMNKLFLVKTLSIAGSRRPNLLSEVMTRISKCYIWSFYAKGQCVSWNEFQLLLESGNVERFVFLNGKITVPDGSLVAVEDVIEKMPKAHTVIFNSAKCTSKSFSRLTTLKRNAKFKYFSLERVPKNFQFSDFQDFVLNHADHKAKFTFEFEYSTPANVVEENQMLAKSLLTTSFTKKNKPSYIRFKKAFNPENS